MAEIVKDALHWRSISFAETSRRGAIFSVAFARSGLFYFIRPDGEFAEFGDAEGCGQGYVYGVAAVGHEDSAYSSGVVSGVAGPPLAAEVDFEPGAEIAWGGGRDADFAEVAGGVTGGDIHAAAEGDGEMGEVAADALALAVDVGCGEGGTGEVVAEGDVGMDPLADGFDAGETFGRAGEEFPGGFVKEIDFAVAACEEELENFGGEFIDGMLAGAGIDGVEEAGVVDCGVIAEAQGAGLGDDSAAGVAEDVGVGGGGDEGLDA